MSRKGRSQAVLFDWGDTVMRVFPDETGPMDGWRRVEAVPGVDDAIRALKGSAEIALATNAADSSRDAIWRALGRARLDDLFDRVYCFRAVGFRKPSQGFFDAVRRDLGTDAKDTFMVGDDFPSDIIGANAAGLAAVWYAPHVTDQNSGERWRAIREFAELPRALSALGLDIETR